MNKEKIIKHLHIARAEHVFWVKEGRKLLKGVAEEEIRKPQKCDVCNFSRWYEEEGHKLVNIPQLQILQDLHHEIHSAYTSLYFTTFDRRSKARATIISGDVEIPISELPFRRKKLKALEKKTIEFIKLLIIIEDKVGILKDEIFENGWLV